MSGGIKSLPKQTLDLETACSYELEQYCCNVTVGWGDCDPAQIAYTARIPAWALTAIEAWYVHCFSVNWFDMNIHRGIGTPFVSLGCDFRSPVTTNYPLKMTVYVSRLGNASLSHLVEGFQNNVLCFTAKTTAAFADAKKMESMPIPKNMRLNIENYVRNQDREFEGS
ncbi:MAG: acyl-CoA thioesterase [Gammaproteobacteria bacterium]|nr:acyl-CoA thioesterase [Gammaproteobacteria bacterium]